jgi:toxin-antitoxin system, toxin component, Txe/YoeB family
MSYKIAFTPQAMDDFNYWKSTDPKTTEKIKILLREIQEQPFTVIGKPEPLKYQFSGAWSRRINHNDRLVYQVDGEVVTVFVLAMRFHYDRQ